MAFATRTLRDTNVNAPGAGGNVTILLDIDNDTASEVTFALSEDTIIENSSEFNRLAQGGFFNKQMLQNDYLKKRMKKGG